VNRASNHTIVSPFRAGLILGVTTIVGAALRLHQLSAKSFWIDEGASVSFATMPWRPFLRTLWNYQGNMTLYYFLLRAWIHLGDSEFVVRSLSVLLAVLTIPAIYFLGKRLFDPATGLTAAALLSVHSFHIQWSQEARAYSLLTLLLVLAAYFLICAMEAKESTGHWIAFAVTAALSLYAHIFAVFVLAAFALSIAFPKPFRVRTRSILLVAILFEHLIAPMALFVLVQHGGNQLSWLHRPSFTDIYEFLLLLTSQGGILLVVTYLSLAALAFVRSPGSNPPDKERWTLRLLLLWLVLPPLLTLAASPIKPLFSARYMVLCVPALVLLAARGLSHLYNFSATKRWIGAAALLLVMTLSAWGTYQYFVNFPAENTDWRSAVNYILENQQPGDGAVFYTSHALCYRYYAGRAERQHRVTTAPDVLYPPDPRRPVSREEITNDTAGRQRVWLVLHDEQEKPDELASIQSTLAEQFQPRAKRAFPGKILITVVLYSQASGTPK
jgi:mannosyltransferase